MNYRRKTHRSKRNSFHVGDYVPIWTDSNTKTVNLMFRLAMGNLGVHDVPSYFHVLRVPIGICTLLGAAIGAHYYGPVGVVWGSIAGVCAPAGLVMAGIALTYIAVILLVFFVAWILILSAGLWLFGR